MLFIVLAVHGSRGAFKIPFIFFYKQNCALEV
jgi:hypothetical protein